MRRFDLGARRALDRIVLGDQVVEQHAEAVDVGGRGRRSAAQALGAQIQRRAGEQVESGCRRLHRSAGAEVHEDDAAALLAHHVVRLDVAVDEALGVDGGERAAQRPADDDRLVGAVRAAGVDLGGQRPAAHELHPQADAAVVLVGAVHDDDVGMLDAGEEAAFVEHPRGRIVAAEARRQQLHGDVAAERIDGPIDLRERAAADRFLEAQRAPGRAAQVVVGAGRRSPAPRPRRMSRPARRRRRRPARGSPGSPRAPRRRRRPVPRRPSRSACPRRRGRRARGGQPAGHRASRVISLTSRATARCVATREAAALGRPSRSASSL